MSSQPYALTPCSNIELHVNNYDVLCNSYTWFLLRTFQWLQSTISWIFGVHFQYNRQTTGSSMFQG